MTTFPKIIRGFFVLLLAITMLSMWTSLPSSTTSAQSRNISSKLHPYPEAGKFILYKTSLGSECRIATPEEVKKLYDDTNSGAVLHPISPLKANAGGLNIILMGTSQLESFPAAKAGFIRAAANWQAIIQSPITIVINVDFGSRRFGQSYPPGVIGSTNSQDIGANDIYSDVRDGLVSSATSATQSTLYSALPTGTIPTDIGNSGTMNFPSSVFRALGLIDPVANPSAEQSQLGAPPSIGFNSGFNFDFNPDDGITSGSIDFDATATHEIGHALGFTSNEGLKELASSFPVAPTVWDLFRFRPGTSPSSFSTAQRVLSSGGTQVFYDMKGEINMSTGRPDGSGGDRQQGSHWKSSNFASRIGIMAPTLADGERAVINDNDIRAIASFGYSMMAINDTVPPAIKVNAPNSGEVLLGNNNFTITWTSSDDIRLSTHDISLSTDGGATFPMTVATGLAGSSQSFLWTVPKIDTSQARIRITAKDVGGNATSDTSDANFSIASSSFALNLDQTSKTIGAGTSTTFNLMVQSLGGFTQPVTLSSSVSPSGVTATLSSTTVTPGNTATLTVATTANTPSGAFVVTLTGVSAGVTRVATATVNVVGSGGGGGDFTISATPGTQDVTVGKATSFTVNTAATGGFNSPITLSATATDPTVNTTFSSNPTVPGNSVTLTVITTASTPVSVIPVTIRGASGQVVKTATVMINVKSATPDFMIGFATNPLTVSRKQAGQFVVTINRINGFSGNVTVTAPNTKPFKVTLTGPTTQSTSGNSVSFSFKVKKKAPLGSQQLTFSATDGSGITRTAVLNLVIQ